jgi:hypothetical protein
MKEEFNSNIYLKSNQVEILEIKSSVNESLKKKKIS